MSFQEAALAMKDPLSLDFDDLVEPENMVTLAASLGGRILYVVATARDAMKKQNEPSAEALREMPEIDDERFQRRPGRGHHVARSVGEIVAIDADVWAHFGSAEAVNDALRQLVADKKAAGS
ncbi:MAG: hypothetical protein K8M05_06330 [Deltaproteobacteria bacterium]|nr:hypothetical protein [Kofleriaceae bacterium]